MKNYKIIQTQDYLLVVDENQISVNGEIGYYKDCNVFQTYQSKLDLTGNIYKHFKKVLAHLPLNNSPVLEGVDLLAELPTQLDLYLEIDTECALLEDVLHGKEGKRISYIRKLFGDYKAATKTYSEGNLQGLIQVLLEAHTIGTTVFMKRKADEYIQSLNKPKLPVGFEAEYNKSPLEEMMPEMEGRLQFSQVKTIPNEQGIPVWQGTYVY